MYKNTRIVYFLSANTASGIPISESQNARSLNHPYTSIYSATHTTHPQPTPLEKFPLSDRAARAAAVKLYSPKVQRLASPSTRGAICRRGPFSLLLSFGQAKERRERAGKVHIYAIQEQQFNEAIRILIVFLHSFSHMYLYNRPIQIKMFMLSCITMLVCTITTYAQDDYNTRAKQYIDKYYDLAITEQKIAGIPACVTLGQGILETEAGASELMTKANNHFGIKCKNGWDGDTFLHDDDAKNECFKKYKCAQDSYRDHSQHLKINPRYASLFTLPVTDYAGWARGLKRCGYATDPQYAPRLIKIIEDFELQQYTYAAMDTSKYLAMKVTKQQTPTAPNPQLVDVLEDSTKWVIDKKQRDAAEVQSTTATVADTGKKQAAAQPTTAAQPETDPLRSTADSARDFITHSTPPDFDSSAIVHINGLKAFYAHKGDMLLQDAVKYNVRYAKLLEINDLADGPLPDNSVIYLEKKPAAAMNAQHTVVAGETLWTIAQKETVQLKRLTALNMLSPDDIPAPGAVLQLQFPASKKPACVYTPSTAHKDNAIIIVTSEDKANAAAAHESDYITLRQPAAQAGADTSFIHTTDATVVKDDKVAPKKKPATTFPKPKATTPVVQGPPPVVVMTTKAPEDNNAPVQWVKKDTTAVVKTEALTEDEQYEKKQELAKLKAELDKVVYTDDSKLATSVQTEKPLQKIPDAEAAPAKSNKYYTVKKGDTAFSIAKKHNITVKELYKWNDIDASDIKAGKKLKVAN